MDCRMRKFCRGVLVGLFLLALYLPAAEEQSHGVVFEKWVRETFFGGYKPDSYTQKWDIPAEFNKEHGGVPANPKATKFGTPIDMGDALRQFAVAEGDQSFLVINGFWDQDGTTSAGCSGWRWKSRLQSIGNSGGRSRGRIWRNWTPS